MKRILIIAISILLFTSSAFALSCPDESKRIIYDDGQGNFSFEYTCDNGRTVRVISMAVATSVESQIELTTGVKCITHENIISCMIPE